MIRDEEDWLAEAAVEHLEEMDEDDLARLYHQGYQYASKSARVHTRLDSILVHLRDAAARSAENAGPDLARTLVDGYNARIASTSMVALKKTLTAQRDGVLLAEHRRLTSQHSLAVSSRAHRRSLAGEGTYRMRHIYFGEG